MNTKKRCIVDQLRQTMRDSGQTEYAIAKGSGVSQSVVNRFVSGERGISLDTAAKLCDYLDLDLRVCRQGQGGVKSSIQTKPQGHRIA